MNRVLLAFAAAAGLALTGAAAVAHTPEDLAALLKATGAETKIVKPPRGLLKYSYLTPSGPYYQLFDWDMYFMGVALSYDRQWRPVADSVKDFLIFVDPDTNTEGYAPRIISPDKVWALPQQCKPFLAQAALLAAREAGDFEWLKPLYPKFQAMLNFWEQSRRANDGLFLWFNGMESGVDNGPAVPDDHGDLATEGVDLQVYLYREYQAVAAIGRKLGDARGAAQASAKAESLRRLMMKKMWNEKDGVFYNVNARTGEQIKVLAWTNLTPLWAKMVPAQKARRMIVDHLLNPNEFWARYGVRSLALHEPLYDPQNGYWQGPVWILTNYLMMHGLMNYGFESGALELAQRTVDLLVNDLEKTGGMNECYNPETGAPGADGHFVSWNLLAGHMLQEAVNGADPTAL